MSEQNQLAISPVVAGTTGAVAGLAGGYLIKPLQKINKDFAEAQNLLTMEADTFEKIKPADDAEQAIKDQHDVFVKGREELDKQAKEHEKGLQAHRETYATELKGSSIASDPKFDKGTFKDGDKTISELETAVATEEGKIDAAKMAEDADVKTAQTAYDNARSAVKAEDIAADANVKNAQSAYDAKLAPEVTRLEGEARAKADSALAQAENMPQGTDAEKAARQAKIDEAKAAIKSEAAQVIKDSDEAKALRQAEQAFVDGRPEVKSAKEALTAAQDAYIGKQPAVKTAREALKKGEDARLAAIEAELRTKANAEAGTDGPLKTILKKVDDAKTKMAEKFDKTDKAKKMLEGTDNKYAKAFEKIKGLLPRNKWTNAIIGAAGLGLLGVALAYIVGPKNPVPTDVA